MLPASAQGTPAPLKHARETHPADTEQKQLRERQELQGGGLSFFFSDSISQWEGNLMCKLVCIS